MTRSGVRLGVLIVSVGLGMSACGGKSSSSTSGSSVSGYTVGGTISALAEPGLVLGNKNGSNEDSLQLASNITGFTFPNVATGATYAVSVLQQPTGQSCLVFNASGTMGTADVDNVGVTCGVWNWINGISTTGGASNYGSEAVGASTNLPAARAAAMTWSDASHNFWMFGGTPDGSTYLNDLWLYVRSASNVNYSTWVWYGGTSSSGSYGTEGQFSANNLPPARSSGVTWVTTQSVANTGNGQNYLWMFGGQSGTNAQLNDLWVYDPLNFVWEWVSGLSTPGASGAYGTLGQGSTSNTPGARSGAVSWVDSSGNLWLFGGQATVSGSIVQFNDLWKCACAPSGTSASSAVWTWVSGSNGNMTPNAAGVYGTLGQAASANVPSARSGAVSWIDSSGNLWLFGGQSISGGGDLNDLWRFNPATSQWTWMGGSSSASAANVYGTQGVVSASYSPGARDSSSAWIDDLGNLWLFGGQSTSGGVTTYYGDLWYYTPPPAGSTGTGGWAWASGSTTTDSTGVYGTEGTGAIANYPGARAAAASWVDGFGDEWLFGGVGSASGTIGYYQDLWEYMSAQ